MRGRGRPGSRARSRQPAGAQVRSGRVGSGGSEAWPRPPPPTQPRAPRPPSRPGAAPPLTFCESMVRDEALRAEPVTRAVCGTGGAFETRYLGRHPPCPVPQRSRPSAPNPRARCRRRHRRRRATVARVKGRPAEGRGASAPRMRMRALAPALVEERMERCLSACAFPLQLPLSLHPFSCAIAAGLVISHWAPSSQACGEVLGASSAQDASRTYSVSPLSLGRAVGVGQAQLFSRRKYAEMERQGKRGGKVFRRRGGNLKGLQARE